MQVLKEIFVLFMILLVVFPVIMAAVPSDLRTPFEVKVELISRVIDGFEPFPSFPSFPNLSNPGNLVRLPSYLFSVITYCGKVLYFFNHNIARTISVLSIIVIP